MKKLILQFIFIITMLFQSIDFVNAQDMPPPPPSGHDQNGNSERGNTGAPIGDGLLILLVLAYGYGVKKVYIKKDVSRTL